MGTELVEGLGASPHVASVTSPWTAPAPERAALISRDGRSGLIVVGIAGDESNTQQYAKDLSDRFVHDRDGVTVRAGGDAMVNVEITEQSQRDLLLMESLAIPISFVVLVWVFGGVLAAAVPLAVGGMRDPGRARRAARCHELRRRLDLRAEPQRRNGSGAGHRLHPADHQPLPRRTGRRRRAASDALVQTMATAGRTVLFSATIVALSMAVMVLFPMAFLKSFAYAGVATVAFAAVAALFVTPAALVLLGDRLQAWDIRRLIRRVLNRPEPAAGGVEGQALYRWTKTVMRHALPAGLAVVALLAVARRPVPRREVGVSRRSRAAADRSRPTRSVT